MSEAEFWASTLYEIDLLTLAQRRKHRREALPLALLVQMTANIHRDTQQRFQPFTLEEVLSWLGHVPEPEPTPEPERATPDELREKFRLLSTMYPKPNGQP